MIGYLYSTPSFFAPDAEVGTTVSNKAQGDEVHYVVTDSRLTKAIPPSGSFFPGESELSLKPIPAANLNKYNHVNGISRVYDDGDIKIYDLQSLGYVPQKP